MKLLTRTPCAALAPFIAVLWHFRGHLQHSHERIMPDGKMQLLINLDRDVLHTYEAHELRHASRIRGAGLSGVHDRPFAIDTLTQRCIMGVSFTVAGAYPFFEPPASVTADMHLSLEEVWGVHGRVLRERLLEAPSAAAQLRLLEEALLERALRPLSVDRRIVRATALLDRGAEVRLVASEVGMPSKSFGRLFVKHVGLTPKRFTRVRRFQRLLHLLDNAPPSRPQSSRAPSCQHQPPDAPSSPPPLSWAQLAVAVGYYDQAHLIRDFQHFAGMRPSTYRARGPGEHNHALIAPAAGPAT